MTNWPLPQPMQRALAAAKAAAALGEVPIGAVIVKDGVVQVDPKTMMTGHAGIFAGGDMVPADRNVTVAVGHGKKAARQIDAWLRGVKA